MAPGARGGPCRRAALAAHVRRGPGASHVLLTSLPGFAADLLSRVPHALAFVRIGLAQLSYVRGDLADLLLVDALDDEPGRRLHPEGDALWSADEHRVTESERELQVLAPGLHAIANPDDLHRLGIALRHAGDHVGDQRAGQAVQSPDLALIRRPGHGDHSVVLPDLDR